MIKNSNWKIIVILIGVMCLSGCGKTDTEKELADFSSSISEFTTVIKDANEQINSIDTSSDDASGQLLEMLDNLDAEFKELAELAVPEQYKSIEDLADEASVNMTNAVSYYHSAYESEEFNEQDADIAYEYYTRAMTRIQYIGYVLVGEIPEGENITIHEEILENKLLDSLLRDDEENIEDVSADDTKVESFEFQ